MRVWQKYLPQIIALQSRAKEIEHSIGAGSLIRQRARLTPSQVFKKLESAETARGLYTRAHRLCLLVAGVADYNAPPQMAQIREVVETGLRRTKDIIQLLNTHINDWGLKDNSKPEESEEDAFMSDSNSAEDNVELDALKAEIKHSLKALSNIVDYMEKPTLLTIRKELDRLVNY